MNEPVPEVKPPVVVTSDRDKFWKEKGYEVFWKSTPKTAQIGKPVETYFKGEWSNHQKVPLYITYDLTIAPAPDGSPSIKAVMQKGDSYAANIKGMQFGSKGPEAKTVWSLKWYNPCVGGQKQNNKSGTYIGFGHIWGGLDNASHSPGGSRNYKDAWSVRIPLSKSNRYFIYAYKPDKPAASGQSWVSGDLPKCDQWTLLELEITQNSPVTAKNGSFRMYINKKLAREVTGIRTRELAGVRPRGFGFFVSHNSGAPQKETFYYKDWAIYQSK